jgi:hypothetical protein
MGSDDPSKEPDDEKVIDLGFPSSERRVAHGRIRWRLALGVAILALGGVTGYALGDRHGTDDQAHRGAEPSKSPTVNTVAATGLTCSMQEGSALSVGVQLVNRAERAIDLDQVTVELPTGSRFHLITSFWGPCDTANSSRRPHAITLEADATAWVSATVASRALCAIPDPVVFVIDYDGGQKLRTQFSSLGDGRYNGCGE